MAGEVIAMYGDNVRVITRPPRNVIVQEWGGAAWKDVKIYSLGDDIWALAREAAKELAFKKATRGQQE